MVRLSTALVTLAGVLLGPTGRLHAESQELRPRIGETVQEFEARRRGVTVKSPATRAVVIPADAAGHFIVAPLVDGRELRMIVDTGASLVALTYEDARDVGAALAAKDFVLRISTANGPVAAAPFRIRELRLGDIVVSDVDAIVLPKGRLETSLLGMNFLKRLSGLDISQGRLSLRDATP